MGKELDPERCQMEWPVDKWPFSQRCKNTATTVRRVDGEDRQLCDDCYQRVAIRHTPEVDRLLGRLDPVAVRLWTLARAEEARQSQATRTEKACHKASAKAYRTALELLNDALGEVGG
jgi:hypothetical protein